MELVERRDFASSSCSVLRSFRLARRRLTVDGGVFPIAGVVAASLERRVRIGVFRRFRADGLNVAEGTAPPSTAVPRRGDRREENGGDFKAGG